MLTRTERDEIRANVAPRLDSAWLGTVRALLDDLDAQDAEVARLTADNDRLIVIAKADEWQVRYWAEHDAVADREATIMAERAQSAAMREGIAWAYQLAGLVGQPVEVLDNLSALANGEPAPHEWKPAMREPYSRFWRERATGAAELKEIGEQLEADRTATADGVTAIKRAVASRRWLTEDGRGSYEWDDDRYRGEFRQAVTEIETALEPLAKIAADWKNCPQAGPAIAEARRDLKSANVALRQRAEAAEAKVRIVDDVLIFHHLGPRDDGDYRQALANLVAQAAGPK